MLPSNYTSLSILYSGTSGAYIDTGLTPSDNLSVQILFAEGQGYVFGARNTNSNTSAGQMNFYKGASGSADYVGWVSARVSQTLPNANEKVFNLSSVKNEYTLVSDSQYISEFTGATTSFSGTRNIYLFGLNNAGTLTKPTATVGIYGCKFIRSTANGDVLQRDFVPVYDSTTNTYGMYDLVNDVYYQSGGTAFNGTYRLLQADTDGHGSAKIYHEQLGYLDEQLVYNADSVSFVTVVAKADEGYVFHNWTINGTEVSRDKTYSFDCSSITADTTITANFLAVTQKDQKNPYLAVIQPYGIGTGSADSNRNATYLEVKTANIKEDLLQRSTSTIECLDVPDGLGVNRPIFIYNPKGKLIYTGIVVATDGNILTCREVLSVFDYDKLQNSANYNAHYNSLRMIYDFAVGGSVDVWTSQRTDPIYRIWPQRNMPLDPNKLSNVVMPVINTEIVNGEDRLINAYANYDVILECKPYRFSNTKTLISATPVYSKMYETLVIGDNMEILKDVSITTEEADATVLNIYNSSLSTYRATYYMNWDGTITTTSGANNIGRTICKTKVVGSDDNLKTLAKENLNAGLYNHKITFELALDGAIRFEDLTLGQPVRFYYGNVLYESAITGWEFTASYPSDDVLSIKITLGNVRNNLTSKLNLGKVK